MSILNLRQGIGRQEIVFVIGMLLSGNAIAENPHAVTVQRITTGGTGCPAGTVSATISPDSTAFSLLMDNYMAESHGNQQIDRKNCEVRVELGIPQGWSYAIISADYRGFVNVDAGSIATHQAIYSFDGSRPINERPGFENSPGRYSFKATEFRGPHSDNYYINNEIHRNIAPWSPCSGSQFQTLYISTYLMSRTVSDLASSTGIITLDSIDGSVQTQKFGLAWKRCTPNDYRPDPNPDRQNPDRPGNPVRPPRPNPRPPRYR